MGNIADFCGGVDFTGGIEVDDFTGDKEDADGTCNFTGECGNDADDANMGATGLATGNAPK